MSRLVHRVRLHAPAAHLVQRGAFLLEDALRTASLPGAGPGRLLLVRYLHVGTINPARNPVALAMALEERMRLLRATAVHAATAGAPAAQAVYFHDEAEAYTMLALRLVARQPISAWFWRLVAPHLDPRAPLRSLLYAIPATSVGTAMLLRVLTELAAREALDPLLATLTPTDGARLLALRHWSAPVAAPALPPNDAAQMQGLAGPPAMPTALLASAWRAPLARWIKRWGSGDPRSHWLATSALVATHPPRLLDPTLPIRAALLTSMMTSAPTAQPSPVGFTPEPDQDPHPTQAPHTATYPAEATTDELPPSGGATFSALGAPVERSSQLRPVPHGDQTVTPRPSPARTDQPGEAMLALAPPLAMPPVTRLGGLFFLLPVLERLGLRALLAAQPHWIEADLGWALLRIVAARLGLTERDPLHHVLGEAPPDDPALTFVAPATWHNGPAVLPSATIHRVEQQPGLRVIIDRTGRLLLARWSHQRPAGLHELRTATDLRRGATLANLPSPTHAWITAARRWLRRSPAHIGLRDLVTRPALVSITTTHLDLTFDHSQTDLRLRRHGLDFNPGWVPWLGKVVSFHYANVEELRYAL
ncbi:hypothetical protein EYB53_016740 [Candidatus Chloroploca sp. M-50]|uniref:Uncharacterized protein n=1 Tax=Candidatus Chloroploca mongolica TaxID=2528176 RepID=A0ABS4DD34_9CHLR|nr:hypothetical protein [Candidatus Chloroploca mongolica]MBP1467362.1 hypothetical protein [Candidatus Chloroploca mongolica]